MINRVTKNDSWAVNPDGTLGYTCNLITGCLNHTNGLCNGGGFPCFAYRLAHGRLRSKYLSSQNIAGLEGWSNIEISTRYSDYGLLIGHPPDEPGFVLDTLPEECQDPFYPRFWPDRLAELDRWLARRKEPVGVFLCIMGEWLGDWVPESWQNWIMELVRRYPQHRFYLLTKQYRNLEKWSPYPDNCRVGATATDESSFVEACQEMHYVVAKHKFLSVEPLLKWFQGFIELGVAHWLKYGGIEQVIIGAQTKPKKIPKWDWVREIINEADRVGTAVFLKYNLGLPKYDCDGGTPFYFKSLGTMELRQEVLHA